MKSLLLAAALLSAESQHLFQLEPAFETVSDGWSARYSADGKTVAVGKTLWSLETGLQTGALNPPGEFATAALSPDGSMALIATTKVLGYKLIQKSADSFPSEIGEASAEGELLLWDTAADKKIRTLLKQRYDCRPTGNGFKPYQCADITASFSPDGKRVAINVPTLKWRGWRDFKSQPRGDRYDEWTPYVSTLEGKTKKLPGSYAQFVADGRLLSIVFSGGAAQQIVDADTGRRVSYPRNAGQPTVEGGFTEDGRYLYLVHARFGGQGRVQAWRTEDGSLVADETAGQGLRAVPAGGRLLLLRDDTDYQKPKSWAYDLASGRKDEAPPSCEWFSADGRFCLRSNAKGVKVIQRVSYDAAPVAAPAPRPVAATNVDNPPAAKLPIDPNAYAVVIGVERYREAGIPKVDYAARDAATVHRYLTESLGFDAANVVLLQDERATKTDLEKHLGAWLKNRVNDKSRVFVYYAGHGAPNPATGQGFLIPYEGDPNYTDETAYPIQTLYDTLAKLPAKDVTVVLDACFSGAGGRSLLAKGARPLVTQAKATAGGNTSVISAASGAQISAGYPQGRHGLLTYFLLEGLHGGADADKDGAVTTSELYAYARPAVEREARKQNLEQTPTMTGAGKTVWLKK